MGKTLQSLAIMGQMKARLEDRFKSLVLIKKPLIDRWCLEISKCTKLKVISCPSVISVDEKVCEKFNFYILVFYVGFFRFIFLILLMKKSLIFY